jgi:hypothetical protein
MSFAISMILLIGGAVITRVVLSRLRRRQDSALSRFLLVELPQTDASGSVRSQQLRRFAYAAAATALCSGAAALFGTLFARYGDESPALPWFMAGGFVFGLLAVMAGMIAIGALIRVLTGK